MSYARQMLDSYPRTFYVDADLLAAAIDALDDCAQGHACQELLDALVERGFGSAGGRRYSTRSSDGSGCSPRYSTQARFTHG